MCCALTIDSFHIHCETFSPTIFLSQKKLGKTIEALAGAALRNAMLLYDPEHNDLPTLIVSPQDGIQNQWYETLVKSGVRPVNIKIWGESDIQLRKRQDDCFRDTMANPNRDGQTQSYVLCTRYNIQSDLKKLFKILGEVKAKKKKKEDYRALLAKTHFRDVPNLLIWKFRNMYRADKGKEKNEHTMLKEKIQDCVGRLIRTHPENQNDKSNFSFQTIIVDEAHFCKNVLAYWGLGLSLLGSKTRRTVLLTGTPYNNGPSDMTSLMTYIDPSHEAATIDWWDQAVESTGSTGGKHVGTADAVSDWRKAYLLRRTKDVLLEKLPPRIRAQVDVPVVPSELWIYQCYEEKFLSSLKKLRKNLEDASPEARFKAKKTFEIMMACMACMRMSLVHPVLIGGREMTIHFSPSRRHLLKNEEQPRKCVFCISDPTKTWKKAAEKEAAKKENQDFEKDFARKIHQKQNQEDNSEDDDILALAGTARTDMDLDDDKLDDDDFEGDYETKSKKEREREEKKKGPIIPLGSEFCLASGSRCQHFGHEKW